jgi:hypothetical protein
LEFGFLYFEYLAFVQAQALPDVKATKKILTIKSKPTRREGTLPKIKSVRILKM